MTKREPAKGRAMQPVEEPMERAMHRTKCRNYGYTGSCYSHSGMYGPTLHITMACNGKCRRMRKYDKEHGLTGQAFKIREFY